MDSTNPSIMQSLGYKRLEQLDGLRGICALCVLVSHLIYETGDYLNVKFYPSVLLRFISTYGHVAVLIFFVLSGFVIGYTTPRKFTWEEGRKYLIRRLIRLYPVYILSLILTFALTDKPFNILNFIGHAFFLQEWLVPVIDNNLPLWSLHYEFMFYLLFLIIWKFDINLFKAMFVCVLSGILSPAFSFFHPLEILAYFTLWLSGLWLARNIAKFTFVENYTSYRFWTVFILIGGFMAQNILTMLTNRFDIHSRVANAIFLAVPITSSVASLIVKEELRWYKPSIIVVFLSIVGAVIYGWRENFLSSLNQITGYELALVSLTILPLTLLIKKSPVALFRNLAYTGSFSYALYLVHFPILRATQHLVFSHSTANVFSSWMTNLLIAVLSLLTAWFLECYLHVRISSWLKIRFKLAPSSSAS